MASGNRSNTLEVHFEVYLTIEWLFLRKRIYLVLVSTRLMNKYIPQGRHTYVDRLITGVFRILQRALVLLPTTESNNVGAFRLSATQKAIQCQDHLGCSSNSE